MRLDNSKVKADRLIWPDISKVMLEEMSPETTELVDENWLKYFEDSND